MMMMMMIMSWRARERGQNELMEISPGSIWIGLGWWFVSIGYFGLPGPIGLFLISNIEVTEKPVIYR
jgi:hypothetical protein